MSIQILSKENTLILFFRQRLRKKIRVVDKKELSFISNAHSKNKKKNLIQLQIHIINKRKAYQRFI